MVTINPIVARRTFDIGGVPSTQLDDSVGQGLQSFGGAVEHMGNTFAAIDLAHERQKMAVEDFRANQGFERFKDDMSLQMAKRQQDIDPSGQGLTEQVSTDFNASSEAFLKTVPDALKPKFGELLKTNREQWINKAAAAEVDQRNTWYKDGITKTQNGLQEQVFNDPTQLQAAIDEGNRSIDASGLPPTEKKTLKEAWAKTLASTKGEREARDALNNPSSAQGAADRLGISGAANLVDKIIGVESGGNANAKNPNSSASGVGQFLDSTWLAMVKKYRPDLANRKPSEILALKSNPKIAREMTADYAKENADFLQNEGLPASDANIYLAHFLGPRGATQVLKADPSTPVANIVGQDVVNANPFLKGMSTSQVAAWAAKKMGSATSHEPVDPAYAPLSLSDRLKIYDKINAEAQKGMDAIQARDKTAYDNHKGSVQLGIETGQVASRETILTDPGLKDSDKASLLSALDTKLKEGADVSAYISAWSQQSDAAKVNPFDAKESALNEKAFEQVMKTVPEEQANAVAENWIKTTGNVPKAVVANVRQGLNSTNAADVAKGMEEAARIYQVAPTGVEAAANGKDVKDAALAYNEYVYGRGMSSQEAGARWLNLHSPEMVEQRERLKKPDQDFLKTLSVSDVTSALDTSILPFSSPSAGLTPDQQAAVMTDYSKIAEEKFLQTGGDADLAKKMALQDMTKLYGVSDVSGAGVVTKFPPEHYYPPIAGSQDYIRDAALKDAKSVDATALNVNLVPTKETADDIRLGQPPRYRLMFQRQDGVWDAVPGQLFSVSSDEIKNMMQSDSKKRLDAAKAAHQQLINEQAASDKALNTTVGPDWMKARAAEAARERQKMDASGAQMDQDNGKFGQEFLKGMSETIANPPPF